MSQKLSKCSPEAEACSQVDDWEGDTVVGRTGGACLLAMVDRMSGCLAGGKSPSKRKGEVRRAVVGSMPGRPVKAVTLDRGKEFVEHALFTEAVGAECYCCLPHRPWDRGTNESTNGLLRQYFPRGRDLDAVGEKEARTVYDELSRRSCKRLGRRTPHEIYHSVTLHLL